MAKKTMLRQLLSKHALLSTEMQRAVEADQAVINQDLQPEFVDSVEENEVADVIENDSKEQTQDLTPEEDPMF